MSITEQDFHDLLHKDVGTPANRYKLVRRGKRTIRKPIKKEHSSNWSEATVSLGANKVLVNAYLDLQQNDLSNADYQRLKQLALANIGRVILDWVLKRSLTMLQPTIAKTIP